MELGVPGSDPPLETNEPLMGEIFISYLPHGCNFKAYEVSQYTVMVYQLRYL